jgi:hypothetical protein
MRLMETPARITPDVINTLEQAVAALPTFARSMRDADRVRRVSP